MILYNPSWLILLIPMAALMVVIKLPTRTLRILRAATMLLLIISLCKPVIKIPGQTGTIVVVADRSDSMDPESLPEQVEIVDLLQSSMGGRNTLAVVSFGRRAAIERAPQRGEFAGFLNDVGREQSNLAEGIDTAISLIPKGHAGRIVILSDGRWTGVDPARTAVRAAGRGMPLDYRLQQRSTANDVAIHQILAPDSVLPGESYIINAWIYSPVQQDITYKLMRGDTVLAAGKRMSTTGLNRLSFRDTASRPGTRMYTLSVDGGADDPVPENNTAKMLIGVKGSRPMLCVSSSTESMLPALLKRGGMDVICRRPGVGRWEIDDLSNYSSVLIEDVSANEIGVAAMQNIAAWVERSASGLMMTGGRFSFGPGGYFKSPLDTIMPVSMELRREHRKFQLAIIVALDRSGSMMASAGGGKTKMDLANIGSVQVMDMLSEDDEIGILAVDSKPHVIVELDTVKKNRAWRNKILAIDSMGGGIFVYEALAKASQMIIKAESGTRHIILFSDAADSEEPGAYVGLLAKCLKANITVSVIGLGTERDIDADLLKDVAKRGHGQCFFTDKASEIPRLFAQDTFAVARSSLVEEKTKVSFTGGFISIAREIPKSSPVVGGYNLCYLKPGATMAAITVDEFKAPLISSWFAGNGRVLCYTGEADGRLTGPIAKWDGVGSMFMSMARWTAGEVSELPQNMLLTSDIDGGIYRLELHLDPERTEETISAVPTVSLLRGVPGSPPTSATVSMKWESADLLAVDIPMFGQETVLPTILIPGAKPLTLSPARLPYSPEFQPIEAGKGEITLKKLAESTGGEERIDLAGIWRTLPTAARDLEISHWLTLLALLVFLLEILQRRTGILALLRRTRPTSHDSVEPATVARTRKRRPRSRHRRIPAQEAISQTPEPQTPEVEAGPEKEEQGDMLAAMRKASKRARTRTRR